MRSHSKSVDRVEEIDVLKIDWKRASAEDDQRRDLRILHHHDALVQTKWKVSEVVVPLPSWKQMSCEAHQRAAACDAHQAADRALLNDKRSNHVGDQRNAGRKGGCHFMPHRTLWSIRAHGGDIDISDAITGVVLQTIRQPKAGVFPSSLRHVPYCSVYASDVPGPIFYGSALARRTAFDQQLLHLKNERRVQTDFVWVGFVDGTIRLVHSRGHRFDAANLKRTRQEESDYFSLVHELPKCHSAEVVAFETSPFHPSRSFAHYDDVSNPLSYEDAKQRMIANDLLPADLYGQYLCSASADSCVVVWDLADVYREVERLCARQRQLESDHRHGSHIGAKGPRVRSTYVTGVKRSSDPIYIDNFQFSEAENSTLLTYATFVATAKPLLRLKGTVCGMRHIRWAATVVTTKGHQRPRQVVAATRDIGDVEEQDCRRQLKLHQTQTHQDAREERKLLLGLTEEEMREAEQEMALRLPKIVDEPVCSKTVHLLVAGDSNGYVMIWNLAEELSRRTEPPRVSSNTAGLSKRQLDTNHAAHRAGGAGRSPTRMQGPPRPMDFDVRSLASHMTSTATYLRSTDQRIQFSGGVSICGLEPILPREIPITLRRAEPTMSPLTTNVCLDDSTSVTPRDATGGGAATSNVNDLVNEFLPLTDEVALFHVYKHLEIFVAVDGSVQFLSCHPAQLTRESEEQLYRLLDQTASPNRIEARRGLDDEVVGSLDFQTFSVFFSKRVLQYHTQPVTAMRLDQHRKELWVARHDGMVSCFSTTKLKELCRIPHPHANETCPPPSAYEVEEGLAEYHYLAGQPLHLEDHRETLAFPTKSFVRAFVPLQSDVCERIVCLFGSNPHAVEEYVHTTSMPDAVVIAAAQTEDCVSDRLKKVWGLREKRLAERNAAKQGAVHRQRIQRRVQGALERVMDSGATAQRRGSVLALWLRWTSSRMLSRFAKASDTLSRLEQDSSLNWSDFVQQAQAGIEEKKQWLQEMLAMISGNAQRNLLRSYMLRWHEAHHLGVSRRVEVPMILGTNGMRLLRRFFSKWTDRISRTRKSKQLARQQTRFQLTRQMQYGRELVHSSFLKWLRFASTQVRMNEWLGVHIDEHLINTLGNSVAITIRQRYYLTWVHATKERREQRMIDCQRRQLDGDQPLGSDNHIMSISSSAASRHALYAEARRVASLTKRAQLHEVACERIESEFFMAASHLLCDSLESADVLEIEIHGDSSATGTPLSFDRLMNDTQNVDDHRVHLWTAIENLRCENSSMTKAQRQCAVDTVWASREGDYLQLQDESGGDTITNMTALGYERTAERNQIIEILTQLRALAYAKVKSGMPGKDLEAMFAATSDKSVAAYPQLAKFFPNQNAISKMAIPDLQSIAVRSVTQFVLPKLEEVAVFSESASTQSSAWEAIVLIIDALYALEVDGTYEHGHDDPTPELGSEEHRALCFFDLGSAPAKEWGKLQKFVKVAKRVIVKSLSGAAVAAEDDQAS